MKNCGICDKEFTPVKRQKYCSPECQKIARDQDHKRWRDKNPDRHTANCIKWQKDNKERWNKYQRDRADRDREAYNAYHREYRKRKKA